ncbi:hypothetical protein JW823_03285 [bacterium]|nr:hypothetical protein [candidate division CSSED10-310 bacterium]
MKQLILTHIHEIRFAMTVAWFGLTVVFIKIVFGMLRGQQAKQHFRRTSLLVSCIIIALFSYQARWQLFGFFSSDFLRVQRGFDPRGEILATRFHRGSILDHKHTPLAEDTDIGGHLQRQYPLGEAGVHVVGYNHPLYGSAGMEKTLDPILMGRAVQTPADAFRLLANIFFHRSLHGNPVVLTIDTDLQREAWALLSGKTGSIIALDPRTGSIRAMVSRPGFNPETLTPTLWTRLLNRSDSPFLNRATHGMYPPGSTFKILVAATALRRNMNPVYVCGPEGFDCGPADPRVKDHSHYSNRSFKGHGTLNLAEAMALSCNVYFAQLSVDLTASAILETAREAGMDRRVEFKGPSTGSEAGRLPDRSKWPVARTARLGIGQDDILVTPLHLALVAGAMGHGGLMYRPRIIETEEPAPPTRFLDHRIANQIARMMIKTVETGTGRGALVTGMVVGGKTGTAENAGNRSHALFVCFAPWPRPALALAVVIEQGGMGGQVAAPVAAGLIRKADELGLLADEENEYGLQR